MVPMFWPTGTMRNTPQGKGMPGPVRLLVPRGEPFLSNQSFTSTMTPLSGELLRDIMMGSEAFASGAEIVGIAWSICPDDQAHFPGSRSHLQ